jgi:hypothetical protein
MFMVRHYTKGQGKSKYRWGGVGLNKKKPGQRPGFQDEPVKVIQRD